MSGTAGDAWEFTIVAGHLVDDDAHAESLPELDELARSGGNEVARVHRSTWEMASGRVEQLRTPRRVPPPAMFNVLDAVVYVLLAAGAGVVGNRTDAAVMAMSQRLRPPGRDSDELALALDRATALRRAQAAVASAWPDEVRWWGMLDALQVVAEANNPDGSWEFTFAYRQSAGFGADGSVLFKRHDWVYVALVIPQKQRGVVATSVRRTRQP